MAKRNTRMAILEAAERVGRRVGLARVTTKEVAAEAECSEAAIYYHFKDRTDLLAEVVANRYAATEASLAGLSLSRQATLTTRLTRLIEAVGVAFGELIAISAPLVADPDVLDRFRSVLVERGLSPHGIQRVLAEHLVHEQERGHLRSDVDVQSVALMIAGACHEVALEGYMMGPDVHLSPSRVFRTLAETLSTALASVRVTSSA